MIRRLTFRGGRLMFVNEYNEEVYDGYTVQMSLDNTATMDSAPVKTPRQEAEDRVTQFLNGGPCSKSTHDPAPDLDKLITLKMLVLEFAHISKHPDALESEIRKRLKG